MIAAGLADAHEKGNRGGEVGGCEGWTAANARAFEAVAKPTEILISCSRLVVGRFGAPDCSI
jgi:hypothetical protein